MNKFYAALIVMLFSLLLSGCAYRQITVPEVTDSEFAAAYRNDLKTLSSDEFQGRRPGTPGGKMTQEYLINSFKSMGLEPGNNGSYLQGVKLFSRISIASGVRAVSMDGDTLEIKWKTQIFPRVNGEDTTISIKDKELVFVGFGGDSEKFNWHDYDDIDVEGKIVVMLRNHAGFASKDSSVLNDRSNVRLGYTFIKINTAESHGAFGTIMILDSVLAGNKSRWNGWAAASSRGRNSLYDGKVDSSTLKLRLTLNLEVGKQFMALAGYDYDSLVVAAYSPGFKSFDLAVTLSGEFKRKERIYISNNVLGLIRGTERPDEVVIYTAHWDGFGIYKGAEEDSIYNGAADNATGTASILSLGRAFMAQPVPPKRSVLFMGFTAEEIGLKGSRYYADNPVFPLGECVALINTDMLTFVGETNDLIIFGRGRSDLDEYAERAVKKLGMRIQDDPWPRQGHYYSSDHIIFAQKGLPSMSMHNGVDSREHGMEWGMEIHKVFRGSDYHEVSDEYSEDLNLDGIMQYLQVIFDVGYTLANSSKFPNWNKDDEFRPIRDASRREIKLMKTTK